MAHNHRDAGYDNLVPGSNLAAQVQTPLIPAKFEVAATMGRVND